MKDTHFRVALALACITSVVACDRAKSGAEAAVRESLKDPESARFGGFYFNKGTKKGCVTVNARNSMGGYTGDQQAFVERTDEGWEVGDISDVTEASCRKTHADQPSSQDAPAPIDAN